MKKILFSLCVFLSLTSSACLVDDAELSTDEASLRAEPSPEPWAAPEEDAGSEPDDVRDTNQCRLEYENCVADPIGSMDPSLECQCRYNYQRCLHRPVDFCL
jgi:hypothetical protein